MWWWGFPFFFSSCCDFLPPLVEKIAKMALERWAPLLRWHSGGSQVGPSMSMNVSLVSNLQTTDVSSPIFANRLVLRVFFSDKYCVIVSRKLAWALWRPPTSVCAARCAALFVMFQTFSELNTIQKKQLPRIRFWVEFILWTKMVQVEPHPARAMMITCFGLKSLHGVNFTFLPLLLTNWTSSSINLSGFIATLLLVHCTFDSLNVFRIGFHWTLILSNNHVACRCPSCSRGLARKKLLVHVEEVADDLAEGVQRH